MNSDRPEGSKRRQRWGCAVLLLCLLGGWKLVELGIVFTKWMFR